MIIYQPITKAFEPGDHASYHGKSVRTMLRQWVVMMTNGLTMVALTEANRTRHGTRVIIVRHGTVHQA